jgi:hypothetical protein
MNGLLKIFKPLSKDSISRMVERYLHLFEAHDLDISKIPRLIPQIRYDALGSSKQLLTALTPMVIDATAQLFGVRPEWLEGQDGRVYNLLWARKYPKTFLSQFASALALGGQEHCFPLRVLTTSLDLDRQAPCSQLLVPVIVETTGTVGEDILYRCQVYGDYYDWTDSSSRIELKAVALLIHRHSPSPIPLFLVTPEEMERFTNGLAIPSLVWRRGLITNPSLEDFILSSAQSGVAKETDELPAVLSYLEAQGLSNFTFHVTFPSSQVEPERDKTAEDTRVTPLPEQKSYLGKRQTQKDQWWDIVRAAQTVWAQEPTVTYSAMIQRLRRMPHLKASALSESAIHKHIRPVAPSEVRGKPGRKPKQST